MMEKISFNNIRVFFMVFALSICASVTFAGQGDGWGLFVDIGQLKSVNGNTGTEYQQSKVFGDQIDYQFALGESFSLLLFVTEFGGKGALPDNTKFEYYKAGILGAELRAWMGPLFIGIHGGQYYLTWIESLSSYSGIKWSSGRGWGLGLEGESGWSLSCYIEKSDKVIFDDLPDQRVEGQRILLGYRWR
jgi:hypothetical protein